MGYSFNTPWGNIHQGSWLGLPDLSLTERLPQNVQNRFGAPLPQAPAYTPPTTVKITPSAFPGPAGSPQQNYNLPTAPVQQNQPGSVLGATYDQGVQNVNSQGNDALSLIDQDYNNTMSYLASQEQGLRGDASTAAQQAELSGQKLKTSYGEQAATQEAGVTSQVQTAEKQGTSALQQARDLFRQTQQNNIAQLSALGISSSSVSEALAEKLGVETSRRIMGITGSLDEVRQNAVKEITSIKNYVAKRSTEIDEGVAVEKQRIQGEMMKGLDQLNYQRGVASNEKAKSRANILSQVQNNIFSLTQQAAKWKQDLEQWQIQQNAKVYQSVGDLEKSMANATNVLTAGTGISQTDLQRGVTIGNNGQMSGYVKYAPGKKTAYIDPITGQQLDENGNPVD